MSTKFPKELDVLNNTKSSKMEASQDEILKNKAPNAESPKNENPKDENYWKILNAALELDVKKGHLKWTVSDLSRKSRVTRSLIYYYFGRSKLELLKEAIHLIGSEISGLTSSRDQLWGDGDLLESLGRARAIYEKAPFICQFIYEHQNQSNEIGISLREVQDRFREKLKKYFSVEESAGVRALFGVYWGLLFAPEQDHESHQIAIEYLKRFYRNAKSRFRTS